VVPRDAQEGDEIAITNRDFELLMGQPVAFPLASSSVRPDDQPGDLVAADPDSIRELPPLQSVMRVGRKARAEHVPVRLAARVTEVGTIEIWCQSRTDDRRWRLQIQLRGPSPGGTGTGAAHPAIVGREADQVVIEQSELDLALAAIRTAFGRASSANPDHGPARLVKRLEEVLDVSRDQWPPSALRALWEPLRDCADERFQSARHESRWLNLAGYCLRPGVGYPLDEVRLKALWPVFHQGVRHVKDVQCWTEWWVLWRRVAAGLARPHHDEIYRRLVPFLLPEKGGGAAKKAGRPRPEPHELAEMWRCAASLERLTPEQKEALGRVLIKDLVRSGARSGGAGTGYALWCLGRLGARVLLYGPANATVPRETAERWIEALLAYTPGLGRDAADTTFALAQLARLAGDRARDIDEALRARVLAQLAELGADAATMRPVREYYELETEEQGQALGDALPVGLRLVGERAG
jgi:hypothetical protein